MGYQDTHRFDGVAVIESLPPNHKKTGRSLFEEVLVPSAQEEEGIQVTYNFVGTRTEFLNALSAAEEQLFQMGRAPILHVEAHGTNEGILLKSEETVPWEELRAVLTRMNKACGFNLLMFMAMCRGWHLSSLLHPTGLAPVWGLIGPQIDVKDTGLLVATKAFYQELFSSFNGIGALRAANKHLDAKDWTYRFESAELMFCRLFMRYVAEAGTEAQLQERENQIVATHVRQEGFDIRAGINVRQETKEILADHEMHHDRLKEHFMMVDVFPQNRSRFTWSYSDCQRVFGQQGENGAPAG